MQDFQQGNNPQGGQQNPGAMNSGASQQPQRPYQPQQPQRPYQPNTSQQRPQQVRGGMPPYQKPPQKKKGLKMACIIIPIVLFFLALIAGVAIFFGYKYYTENSSGIDIMSVINGGSSDSDDGFSAFGGDGESSTYSTYEALDELSDLDLSLSKIQEIERNCLHDGDSDEETMLKARIIALKHIYTEVFLTEEHRLQTLKNIYMLHAGEFSEEQRDVLKNFFSLPTNEQELWEQVEGKVENFEDFVTKMDEMVTQAAYNEY